VTSQLSDQVINTLHYTVLALVRRDGLDLKARQMSIFLICSLEHEPQTVRGLAKQLRINKSSVTRALDRLSAFDLVRRKIDPTRPSQYVCAADRERR
jgi:DNA-binding MarR family transcriptional regulator